MAEDSYLTISAPSEAQYTEKRSRFLAFAYPVKSEEEALSLVADLRRRYFDARHVCWAYKLGTKGERTRSNDDGEPSGTAGKPILGQITSLGLTQVFVAVVRYITIYPLICRLLGIEPAPNDADETLLNGLIRDKRP